MMIFYSDHIANFLFKFLVVSSKQKGYSISEMETQCGSGGSPKLISGCSAMHRAAATHEI